jgi:hypothetical protein
MNVMTDMDEKSEMRKDAIDQVNYFSNNNSRLKIFLGILISTKIKFQRK